MIICFLTSNSSDTDRSAFESSFHQWRQLKKTDGVTNQNLDVLANGFGSSTFTNRIRGNKLFGICSIGFVGQPSSPWSYHGVEIPYFVFAFH